MLSMNRSYTSSPPQVPPWHVAGQLYFLLGYTKLDRQRNEDTRERLRVQSRVEEIQTNQRKWKEHVERKQDERPPESALKYQPVGKRNTGHPKKR
jgi:hypothetical protein